MIEHPIDSVTDPLSSALMKMKLRALLNVALEAGRDWAVDFPALDGFMLIVIQKGQCLLSIEGHEKTVYLRSGDCFLLMAGSRCTMASNLHLKKRTRAEKIFADATHGVATYQGSGDFFAAGTIFRFQGHLPSLLFARLPPVIHIDGSSDQAAILRWSLERFSAELRGRSIGRSLMLDHLAPIMPLQTLRIYLASSMHEENWLVALSHPKLAKVLEALQNDDRRDWSLDQLADLANMSCSGFALTFKKKVGVPPMIYLMNWRMQIACEMLQAGEESIASIASAVGYGSESAFSVAFQKIVKRRPGAYRGPVAVTT